jgi:putative inorganic carbon (HCO3(-)) transporter
MGARLLDGRWLVVPAAAIALAAAGAAAWNPVLALAAVAGVVVLALVIVYAEGLLLVLAAALPWEDSLAYPSKELSAVKVLGLLLFAAWLLRAVMRNDRLRLPPTIGAVAIFALVLLTSLLLSPAPGEGLLKTLRYALFMIFFFLVVQLVPDKPSVVRLLRIVCLSATTAAVWGLYKFLLLGADRAAGPIADANDFGYLLASVLPLTVYLYLSERNRRWLWGVSIALLSAGVLATLSRGALVGLLAVGLWAIGTRRVRLGSVVIAATALVLVVAAAYTVYAPIVENRLEQKSRIADKNVGARQAYWAAALRMSADHPLTGVGPARFGTEAPAYVRNTPLVLEDPVVHNSYLEILAEGGVFALLAFGAFLLGSWRLLERGHRLAERLGDRDAWRLSTAMQATWILAVVSAIFLSEQLTTPFWLIGGLATVIARIDRPDPVAGRARRAPVPALT